RDESRTRLVGIRQDGGDVDQGRTTEEVAELNDHEQQEERVQKAECGSHGNESESHVAGAVRHGDGLAQQTPSEVAGGDHGPEAEEHRVTDETGDVEREQIREDIANDLLGRREERCEYDEQGG